jgi:hypothetical protein
MVLEQPLMKAGLRRAPALPLVAIHTRLRKAKQGTLRSALRDYESLSRILDWTWMT